MAAPKRLGLATVAFSSPPVIISAAALAGPKEGQGPLASYMDKIIPDTYYGEKTWERAERKMLEEALQLALTKAGLSPESIDFLLAGDLLNQLISANFTASKLNIPFLGLYGACSTMYEALALGSMLIDGGFAEFVLIGVSSHYCTAERQFRYPLEHGNQRTMTAQWTVTGAAACILAKQGQGPRVTHATIGTVIDLQQSDPADMGSAMAPAAAETILRHLLDTGRQLNYYDLIATGDLGRYGHQLVTQLLTEAGHQPADRYRDCGMLIFSPTQDVHAGGSGCACSAVVTCGYIYQQLQSGKLKNFLGLGTGALLSTTSTQQGEHIPAIAHGVAITAG
ncbi:stage V sporulation protein AD [Desulfurispora thermophila]|uniref:stage V sporulation protein AD n=1 Tax=Desulfurispora thermophila TaxID=265470 RepID=UPI0003669EDA|nr:stage V sporulation protein AD [Desulfurispora thermophila]